MATTKTDGVYYARLRGNWEGRIFKPDPHERPSGMPRALLSGMVSWPGSRNRCGVFRRVESKSKGKITRLEGLLRASALTPAQLRFSLLHRRYPGRHGVASSPPLCVPGAPESPQRLCGP